MTTTTEPTREWALRAAEAVVRLLQAKARAAAEREAQAQGEVAA